MDADAKENCEEIVELLEDAGIEAVLLDDSAPGVPEGVFEVRVPASSAAVAEKLIAENPPDDEAKEVDPSSDLDLETIASAASEMEATGIKNVLESNGIASVSGRRFRAAQPRLSMSAWRGIKWSVPAS